MSRKQITEAVPLAAQQLLEVRRKVDPRTIHQVAGVCRCIGPP